MIPDDSGGTDDSSIVLLSHADLPKANRGLGLPILHLQEKPQVKAPDFLETDERMVDHSIRIGKLSMVSRISNLNLHDINCFDINLQSLSTFEALKGLLL